MTRLPPRRSCGAHRHCLPVARGRPAVLNARNATPLELIDRQRDARGAPPSRRRARHPGCGDTHAAMDRGEPCRFGATWSRRSTCPSTMSRGPTPVPTYPAVASWCGSVPTRSSARPRRRWARVCPLWPVSHEPAESTDWPRVRAPWHETPSVSVRNGVLVTRAWWGLAPPTRASQRRSDAKRSATWAPCPRAAPGGSGPSRARRLPRTRRAVHSRLRSPTFGRSLGSNAYITLSRRSSW